jgi:hypothetical protein
MVFLIWLVEIVVFDNGFLLWLFLESWGLVTDVLDILFYLSGLRLLCFNWQLVGFLKGLVIKILIRVASKHNQIQKRLKSDADMLFI